MKNRIISFTLGFLAFILIISTYTALNHQQLKSAEQKNRLIAFQKLVSISDKIEMSLNLDLRFADFFGFLIENDPNISEVSIKEFSKRILEQNNSIDNIGLAPGGIVSFLFPLEGNEEAIGHNLLADKERVDFVNSAIEGDCCITQGPVEAIQGGLLIFNRKAIFIETEGEKRFWGLSTIAVDFNELIKENNLQPSQDGYLFALKAEKTNGFDDFFWGHSEIFEKDAIINTIELPMQTWNIAIYPASGWAMINILNPMSVFFYILAIIVFSATYVLANHYQEKSFASRRDFLTGTLNHAGFLSYFNKNTRNTKRKYGLILIDIDDFKEINDNLGHPVGDKVLIEVANRISEAIGKCGKVSRFGGDEFIIFMDNVTNRTIIDEMMLYICYDISKPMLIDNHKITVSLSAGNAFSPEDGTDFEQLYEISDKRMYCNKKDRKSC